MREPTGEIREPQGFAARASRTAGAYARDHWKSYATATAAGAFMAFVNAFGMINTPLWMRLLYWVPLMLAGAVIGHFASAALLRQPRIGDSRVALWAAVTTAVTIPATVVVWAVTGWMFHGGPTLGSLPYFIGAVLPVSAVMTALMMAVNMPGAATHAPAANAPPAPVRFVERLPAKIMGGVIYAVEAEDHYLRVRTSKGDDLILMRLADAMAELDGIEGAQVHRSWWVAKDGVAEVKRADGRVTLLLKDGAEAPVSRPNVKALREAGWF